MKRTTLIAAAALIAVASTAVIATAHDRGMGPRDARGPAMLFERFDTNSDGAITRAEIEAAALAHFTQADVNGDGQLTADEMAAAADARRAGRQADRIAKRIEHHDTNGDGMLSLQEATAAAAAGDGRIERMFEHLDADGDGTITQAEAEATQGGHGRGRWGKGHGETSN